MGVIGWLRSWLFNTTVVCPRCGETLTRDEAREYDPHGNRWERSGKEFDYFCRPCYRSLTKRADNTVVQERAAAAAGAGTNEDFVRAYLQQAKSESEEQQTKR